MAITYGFYNAINHDRLYDAIDISRIFDGIVKDGVLAHIGDCFLPKAIGDMTVNIGTGRCWFDHSWLRNDAIEPFTFDQPELLLNRYDALVIETDSSVGTRANAIKIIKGTPSSRPQKPAMTHTEYVHQYPICYVLIRADSNAIKQADIEYTVGTAACPFVTGLLEIVTVDEILAQWSAQWHDFITVYQDDLTSWTAQQKAAFQAWADQQESDFTTFITDFEASAQDWSDEKQQEFMDWFEHLSYVLDGDVAGHLQNEIDEINRHGLAGSIINVKTSAPSLVGKTVTVRGANITGSAVFDVNGLAVVTSFTDVGSIQITATDGDETAQTTSNIPCFSNYEIVLEFWRAILHVSTSNDSYIGKTVTVKNSSDVVVATAVMPDTKEVNISVLEPDTYTVTCEDSTNVVVANTETTYEVTLDTSFSYEQWLTLADLDPSEYESLDDVLEDELAIRKLMTIHASIDYLANTVVE